ncbi:MAG: alpha/beta hydrolase [Myxococcota bacterium]
MAHENPDFGERSFVTRDGLRLFYRDYAASTPGGVTALCLHGLTRNSKDFEDLAPRLARSRRVLALDVRGRGRSERDPRAARYLPSTYAQDVLELLEAARVERVAVIGTSMGGILALLLATLRPTVIAGVVLNDIGPVVDPAGIARIAGYVGKSADVESWDAAAEAMGALNASFFPEFGRPDWLRFARRTYRQDPDGKLRPDYDPAIAEATRSGGAVPPDLWSLWTGLEAIPTLAIRGALSDILSEDTLAEMARRKPDLDVLRVANRGHAPTLDEPECVAAIERFLSRI